MVFSVHLQRSAVVAIVNCSVRGQFNGFRSLKQVALQSIWLFQESLIGNLNFTYGKGSRRIGSPEDRLLNGEGVRMQRTGSTAVGRLGTMSDPVYTVFYTVIHGL